MHLPNVFTDTFSTTICKTCGLCTTSESDLDPTPTHCLLLYNTDKDNFIKMLRYLAEMRKKDIVKFVDYLSFKGFCGLFCNNWCPFTSSQCSDLTQVIDCYSEFAEQAHIKVTPDLKAKLFEKFSDVEIDQIGLEFKPTKIKLDKREKKSIMRTVQRAVKALSKTRKHGGNCHFQQQRPIRGPKVKKVVNTTFFFRGDDPEWAAIIRKRLGEEEETALEQT